MQEKIRKAAILLEALPYIREFNGSTFVVKYGGSAMIEPGLRDQVAQDLVLLKLVGINLIVVHGGGKYISQEMEQKGLKAEFRDGLRVTDAAAMEVAEMVLSGKANKSIVSLINKHGGHAVGLSGKDGPFLFAGPYHDEQGRDYGQVGTIEQVDGAVLRHLEAGGYIPVVSPVAGSKDGGTFNVNADEVAGKIAQAIGAAKLIFMTDVDGIYRTPDDKSSLISSLARSGAETLMEQGVISGGMLPKVRSILGCLEQGVDKVHIINGTIPHALLLEIFTRGGIGTEFHLDPVS